MPPWGWTAETVAQTAAQEFEAGVVLPQQIYWTDPYIFFTTREPGVTASLHAEAAEARRRALAERTRVHGGS